MKIIAAILAGGSSSRMGADKAELIWQGQTLLERAARACRSAGLDAIVVGRKRPENWPPLDGVVFLTDETPGLGPLGGLITALGSADASSAAALAIACDMPLLDAEALGWLMNAAVGMDQTEDGLVAVTGDGRLQPLFAIYAQRSLPSLRAYLATGRRSLTGAIEAGRFRRIDAPAGIEAKLTNVNTPEDLRLLGEAATS